MDHSTNVIQYNTPMDILTQGLLGACLAESVGKKHETRLAGVVGFLSGLAADADVLIRSDHDPLLALEFHRHFTHSVFFIPFGALLVALIIYALIPPIRRRSPFSRVYLFSLAGFALSGFIDACTSYGTHLFWPLSADRIAWSIISIVDPIFTTILLVGVIIAFRRYANKVARFGLVLAGVYLLLGVYQQDRATQLVRELAADRGHKVERLIVKPTLGNQILWRSVYSVAALDQTHEVYVDAIKLGVFAENRVYPGDRTVLFSREHDLPDLADQSVLTHDIERFQHFSDDLIAFGPQINPTAESVDLADIRYGNLPNSLSPLWVLRFNPDQPDQHAEFIVTRDFSRRDRSQFMQMLRGEDLLGVQSEQASQR